MIRSRALGRTTALAVCLCMGLAGCGAAAQEPNVTAGMKAIEALDYEAAQTDFEKALVAGEDASLVYRGQGIAWMGSAQYDKAVQAFQKSLSTGSCVADNVDYDVSYYLAAAYDKGGKPAEAEKTYTAILGLKPKEAQAYYLRGRVRLEQGNKDQAKADFDQVITLDPQNYDRLIDIYEALESSGQKETGQAYLKAALKKDAKTMNDYDEGRINYFLGEYETARTFLEKARDAGTDGAAYYLGKSWEALGDYNYAASVYNSYLQDKGKSALIYNQLALCEMKLGDYEKALAAITGGEDLKDAAMAQTLAFNKIVITEYQGDYAKASQLMTDYLKTYPDDAAAQREIQFLQTRS